MAESTPLVLAAGAIVFADRLLTSEPRKPDLRVAVGTGAAALVAAGLDAFAPGFGRGLGVLLVLGALLTSGVPLVRGVLPK